MPNIDLGKYGIKNVKEVVITLLMNFFSKKKQKLALKAMKKVQLPNLTLLTL